MALETASAVAGLALPAIKIIRKIIQAAPTAIQNVEECHDLAGRLSVMHKLLGRLRLEGPEAAEALSGLCDVLEDAHDLVDACQKSSVPRKLASSGDHAKMFSKVNGRIDSHLILIQLCCQVDTTHRLDQIIPPDRPTMVAADVHDYKGGNDHKRFESDGTARHTTGRKRAVMKKVTKITLGIALLCPILLLDGLTDPWPSQDTG